MNKLLAALAVLGFWTGAALAQSTADAAAPAETTKTVAGPSSSVTKTQQTIDNSGVETNAVETRDKSQSFTSGNGELSAKTHTKTTGQSSVTVPSAVVTKRSSTTTTEETSH